MATPPRAPAPATAAGPAPEPAEPCVIVSNNSNCCSCCSTDSPDWPAVYFRQASYLSITLPQLLL